MEKLKKCLTAIALIIYEDFDFLLYLPGQYFPLRERGSLETMFRGSRTAGTKKRRAREVRTPRCMIPTQLTSLARDV